MGVLAKHSCTPDRADVGVFLDKKKSQLWIAQQSMRRMRAPRSATNGGASINRSTRGTVSEAQKQQDELVVTCHKWLLR